ncbi:MAG TPA: hypothetical protein VK111_08945 [Virgibacillus sp.]|nr:hypothetical protein [Virgibacillus sp.]
MKRTVEYILTMCGGLVGLSFCVVGIIFLVWENNPSYLDTLYHTWPEKEYGLLLELMENITMDWIVPGIVCVVLAAVLLYGLIKDRHLLVIAWVSMALPGILTFFSAYGSLPAIFLIITGLIILVRHATHPHYTA